jgi:hypothetical protein
MADNKKSYPNPYNEGEYFSPSDVKRGQDFVRANIPLGLGNAPISPMPQPARMPSMVTSPMSQPMPEPQDDDSGRFLASLIAQGAAGFGTGMMGGSAADIQRSAGTFQTMRDTQENQRRAKLLTDPNSEESKRKREVYKRLGFQVPNNFSATDLNDPTVLQTLKGQMEQSRLAAMPRGGIGVGKVKEEDEIKSDKKLLGEYSKHTEALQSSIDTMEAVKKLNRSRLGKYTPDFSTFTQAEAGTMDRAAAGLIKVLAGPGTVSDSDAARLGGLVPNSNMTRDLAYETTKRQTLEGINKALAGLRTDRDLGRINETDFRKIINQYNRYIKDPKLELNKEINQDGDIIEINAQSSNSKIVTDRQTGKRLEVDQEGNVIREL